MVLIERYGNARELIGCLESEAGNPNAPMQLVTERKRAADLLAEIAGTLIGFGQPGTDWAEVVQGLMETKPKTGHWSSDMAREHRLPLIASTAEGLLKWNRQASMAFADWWDANRIPGETLVKGAMRWCNLSGLSVASDELLPVEPDDG